MSDKRKVLILGASYGSLLATKLILAGHDVTIVCRREEADLINREGTRVRLPVRGHDGLVEIASTEAPGTLTAVTPQEADPAGCDLIALAMQEPQYRASEIRTLLEKIGAAGTPVMSIMNMPPLPYMKRLPNLDAGEISQCYADASVWDPIAPEQITLASPDPQAFRPPEEALNVLQVTLPTNFKVARFGDEAATSMLRGMERDILDLRHEVNGAARELPVKLKVHDSVFVPLAKWAMLLTGNYRCVTDGEARSIREAVHDDPAESREVYEWVVSLCEKMGADRGDMVPFEKYAEAARSLGKPSSAARALYAGAPAIERVDMLVQTVARQFGMSHPSVDATVRRVSGRLEANRDAAA
jgi:NAD(P)-dependent dehydrogenase (short-subunit alcohol dehydrogenase family)